jgi:hypothetical protein
LGQRADREPDVAITSCVTGWARDVGGVQKLLEPLVKVSVPTPGVASDQTMGAVEPVRVGWNCSSCAELDMRMG